MGKDVLLTRGNTQYDVRGNCDWIKQLKTKQTENKNNNLVFQCNVYYLQLIRHELDLSLQKLLLHHY